MSPKFRQKNPFALAIAAGGFLMLVFLLYGCPGSQKGVPQVSGSPLKNRQVGMDKGPAPWSSWNIVLKPGTTDVSAAIIAAENAFIDEFNRLHPGMTGYRITFDLFYCPCDSLLYNIRATLLDGSGESVTSPSPPPPPPGGSGDLLYASVNNVMVDLADSSAIDPSGMLILTDSIRPVDYSSKILAIIDTGLDSTKFSREISRVIWRQPEGTGIYNFIDGSDVFWDDHVPRHGSVVAALALQATMKNQRAGASMSDAVLSSTSHITLPRLMILKALDAQKKGTSFTVSCALSYAIQHNATMINASLGYYESTAAVDSVFRHYINLCDTHSPSIPVFVAAGNTQGFHDPRQLCGTAPLNNELKPGNMFYPACFSSALPNVISVTGLNNNDSCCMYQNWSPRFVTIGVKKEESCCQFSVPFTNCEGTSFATPAAAGTAISFFIYDEGIDAFKLLLKHSNRSMSATKDGKFMVY